MMSALDKYLTQTREEYLGGNRPEDHFGTGEFSNCMACGCGLEWANNAWVDIRGDAECAVTNSCHDPA